MRERSWPQQESDGNEPHRPVVRPRGTPPSLPLGVSPGLAWALSSEAEDMATPRPVKSVRTLHEKLWCDAHGWVPKRQREKESRPQA